MVKVVTWSCVVFLVVLIPFFLYARRYANPFRLTMVFGKKGSGKTTLLTKLALRHLERGYIVYTTIPIPGCRFFNVEDIGKFTFPEHSAVFVDEVGIVWDNRNFKNFRNDVRDYFKFQRQYRNKVFLFSQTFDVDLKLRNLTDSMYLCECKANVFSFARKIRRSITIVNPVGDAESRIADSLEFVHPIWQLFGAEAFILTWIPHWSKYFKSFDPPKLKYIPCTELPSFIPLTRHLSFKVSFSHKFQETKLAVFNIFRKA